jgi:ElaB/YqjD/DUF883 family membrane-anchored ribosome-binding protein
MSTGSTPFEAPAIKEKVSDLGRTAVNKINENRDAAATGLEKAASMVQEKGDKVSSLTHAAAEKLNATAGYVREHDVNGFMTDVRSRIKQNPTPALLIAGAVGFLLGRALHQQR